MKYNLNTTRYANGIVARNSVTGLYWDGSAFLADSCVKAVLLDAGQLAVLRHTYENVIDERVVTIIDEICSVCNATGEVGYFFNATRGRTMLECDLLISIIPAKRVVSCVWRESDGNIELHLRNPDDGGRLAYRVVDSLDKIPGVINEWKPASPKPVWTVEKNNCQWSAGDYRVLGSRPNDCAQVIEAQGSLENMTIIAAALNAAGAKP